MLLGSLVVHAGCAYMAEKETRRAFEEAAAGKHDAELGPGSTNDGSSNGDAPARQGWPRVTQVLSRAADVLATGDPEAVAQLANDWCEEEPRPKETSRGAVRVCFPRPPVWAGGHGFSLELGGEGVVGLVATSLSSAESLKLVDQALRMGPSWCIAPWTAVPAQPDNPNEHFHTCPVENGQVLAVGRFPQDLQADLWQVSLAMLAAT